MKNEMYQLPTIEFIGGETETFIWNLWSLGPNEKINKNTPFNASGHIVTFSLIEFSNKHGTPVISKGCQLIEDENHILSKASVTLNTSETLNLTGKYIYQLTVRNGEGEAEIPGQGIFFIARNIDKSAASGTSVLRTRVN